MNVLCDPAFALLAALFEMNTIVWIADKLFKRGNDRCRDLPAGDAQGNSENLGTEEHFGKSF